MGGTKNSNSMYLIHPTLWGKEERLKVKGYLPQSNRYSPKKISILLIDSPASFLNLNA